MSISSRRRLTQEESRAAALDAARTLLSEGGPQAVTLKAVAGRIGRTHANLLHHFGSAAGLQAALSESVADAIVARIAETVAAARRGEADPRAIVDLSFDAYAREGGASLTSWALLNGDHAVLTPVLNAVHRLVDQLRPSEGESVAVLTLMVTLTAIGDALMGEALAAELGLPRDTARSIMTHQMLMIAQRRTPEDEPGVAAARETK